MTTKGKSLQRHYDKLAIPERLNVALAALERGDAAELRALARNCPEKDRYHLALAALEKMAVVVAMRLLVGEVLLYRVRHEGGNVMRALDHIVAFWAGFVGFCQGFDLDARRVLHLVPLGGSEDLVTALLDSLLDLVTMIIELDAPEPYPCPDEAQAWQQVFSDFWTETTGG